MKEEPAVVALGGGHGLSATLRAARRYAGKITAVVSVADDGGSSGRLRTAFGIPAPGDVRRCLVALADDSLWTGVFEHRFGAGELEGHAFGNLLIAALADYTGDFEVALHETGKLLGLRGQVFPATREPVVLKAEVGGVSVEGQVAVANAGRISGVSVIPPDARTPDGALEAIAAADQIVVGPGSLFTSVLAVVAVPAIRDAIAAAHAPTVYVCNLGRQIPETDGYDVADHVAALAAHGLDVDVVLCHPGALPMGDLAVACVEEPVAAPDLSEHDPALLAEALARLS
ncbi:MAG: YvcK family protein [Acidimicrobiia bacterium]|nr:YvcK family protein [Acidimicrobiia bacterium]